MANSEEMQAAIWVATAVVTAVKKEDPQGKPHTKRSISEHCRPKQAGPMMSQSAFSWKASDRYVEL